MMDKALQANPVKNIKGLQIKNLQPLFFVSGPGYCANTANSNKATMLEILIIGLIAGPAVSL